MESSRDTVTFSFNCEDIEYSKVFKIFENLSEGNLDLIDQMEKIIYWSY